MAERVDLNARGGPRDLIHDALYWGGDTVAAAEAAQKIEQTLAGPRPPESDPDLHTYYWDLCTLEQWRLAHKDLRSAPASITRLRAAVAIRGIQAPEEHQRCADLLDAWHATIARLPDARQRLTRVDSLQRADPTGVVNSPIQASNLIVSRLWGAHGDWALAEAAAFRRFRGMHPAFLSTHLLEEGRAAALAGHHTAAIRALQHYLALRYDPEPSVRPEVEAVRSELARLVGEPSRLATRRPAPQPSAEPAPTGADDLFMGAAPRVPPPATDRADLRGVRRRRSTALWGRLDGRPPRPSARWGGTIPVPAGGERNTKSATGRGVDSTLDRVTFTAVLGELMHRLETPLTHAAPHP